MDQFATSSFQTPWVERRTARSRGATTFARGGTASADFPPLMTVVTLMVRISMGAGPPFTKTILIVYLSPGFTEGGSTSNRTRPGMAAACVLLVTAIPEPASKPGGAASAARVSTLWACVVPETNVF